MPKRRGPAPKPPKLKAIQGGRLTPSQKRANPPEVPRGRPRRPAWLKDEALREWRRITRDLDELDLLARAHRPALAAYCEAYALNVWSVEELKAKGVTFETDSGYVQQHPAVAIGFKAREQMHKYLTEFGLTPSSISRISVPKKKPEKDAWAKV